jgi:predicted transcriptional regulator
MSPRKGFLGGRSPAQVQSLLDERMTQRALAQRLGVTRQAVNRFVRRHRLAGSGRQTFRARQAREVAERRQQVQRLVQAGLKSAEVAKRLGVSPATIGMDRQALRLGRVLKGPEHRTLRGLGLDQVRGRLMTVSRAQLARELGVSSSAVYRYCGKVGLSRP